MLSSCTRPAGCGRHAALFLISSPIFSAAIPVSETQISIVCQYSVPPPSTCVFFAGRSDEAFSIRTAL